MISNISHLRTQTARLSWNQDAYRGHVRRLPRYNTAWAPLLGISRLEYTEQFFGDMKRPTAAEVLQCLGSGSMLLAFY